MKEGLREKLQAQADPFLDSGETVRLGVFGQALPPGVSFAAAAGGALAGNILLVALGASSVLGAILFGVGGALVASMLVTLPTRRKNGLVVVTEHNLYLIRPGLRIVAKHSLGSVNTDLRGSFPGKTLLVGDEKLYLPDKRTMQGARAVIAANVRAPEPRPGAP